MRILARYITAFFVRNLLVVLFALAALHLFQSMLGMFVDSPHTTEEILFYHALQIPELLVLMAPPAVLIATMLTLSNLNRTNELIAIYSIGISLKQIVFMILSVVLIVCSISLVLQDRVLPPLFRKKTTFYWRVMKKHADFYFDVKQDKIWYRSKNLIYNLRNFDAKSKIIYGMTLYQFDDQFKLSQVLQAKQADFTPQGWLLRDGLRTELGGELDFPKSKSFKTYNLQIAETPKDFQEIEKEVDGLRIKELYAYIQRLKETGTDIKAHLVKLHSRLSMSFIPLVMAILAVPFSVRGRREGGALKDVGLGLAVTFFYWLFYSVGLSLGMNGALPPWLAAWGPSVIFFAVAMGLVSRKSA